MLLSYDPTKNQRNIQERGIDFNDAALLEWATALVVEDRRQPYPEPRFQVLGMINAVLHMLVFTPRGTALHVISLRRANRRERTRYDAAQAQSRETER